MGMIKRPSKRRFRNEPGEAIHIIALWNLMIVLIPFLLLSAVFSRTAILNIYLPESDGQEKPLPAQADQPVPIVSILKDGFVIQDAERVLAAVPQTDGEHDFERLATLLLELKRQIPKQEAIILLSEPQVAYETIIHTMDASRETWIERQGRKELISLFPSVSLGEVGEVTFQEVLKAGRQPAGSGAEGSP